MKSEYPNIDSLDPRACISRKVKLLDRMTSNIFRKHLSPYHITDSQLSILFVIAKKGTVIQKEICQMLRLEKSSVNRNLKRLIDNKHISKQNAVIKLTNKGKRLLEKVIPEWEKAMKEIRHILKEDGEDSLNEVLNKFK